VRVLCKQCKERVPLDPIAWEQLVQPWAVDPPLELCRPVGCKACRNTGYRGRQGIYEVLLNSPAMQQVIVPNLETAKIRKIAMSEGMQTLRLSGAARVSRGETTIEEVMRVAPLLDA
jgi:general secretion pathway protein E